MSSVRGILLVSEKKVKAFSDINENLDTALLLPMIEVAQEIGLQTLLGSRFYNHILDAASGNTLTGPETILVNDYIAPYLLWRAVYEATPSIYMRLMNKSISIGESPNSKAIDKGDLSYLRNIQQSRYEFYSQRLMDYILWRQADFPDYFQYIAQDGMPASQENYFGGIHIGPGARRLPRGFSGLPNYSDPAFPGNCCGGSYYNY
jgi:hypothetical protein